VHFLYRGRWDEAGPRRRELKRNVASAGSASSAWAPLPLIATTRLGLGAGGYGLLLAALGVGAIAGALILPRLRARLSANALVAAVRE